MKKLLDLFGFAAHVILAMAVFGIGTSKAMAQEKREYVPFVEEGKTWYCYYPYLNFAYAQGEDYRPMLEDMKTWEYDFHHFDDDGDYEQGLKETVYTVRYTLSGDTVINGVGYHKMYRDVGGHLTYYAAYREEGKKVYERVPREEWDFIVADFEYEGLYDPWYSEENDDLYSSITDDIDYVKVNWQVYRRHTYRNDCCWTEAIGVEGIGYAYYGLEYPSVYAAQPTCICDYQVFTACYDKDGNVFRASDFNKIGIRD